MVPTEASEGKRPGNKDAATKEFHRSPTLIRAVSSRYPTPLPAHLRLLSWFLALLMPSLFYIGPLMLTLPPALYMASPRAALGLLVMDVVLLCYPTRKWPWIRGIFQLWYERFDFHHNFQVNGSPEKPVELMEMEAKSLLVCAMHPHGVIPIQAFLWMAFCDQYLPKAYGFGAAADAVMYVPLLRQILSWGSAGSASRHVLKEKMQQGTNLFLLPGGVAEIFLSKPGTHVIKAKRHGLMKLALQTGAALVPVYVFGGNDFYHQIGGSEKVSRSAKAAFLLFWGQYGLPLPFSTKCSMVLGDPIFPGTLGESKTKNGVKRTGKQVPNPSNEEIEELLERYIDAMHRLFDQYKAQAGYPNAKLEIR